MSWGAKRNTAREEDGAYCLLGIFNIYIPLIYGERRLNLTSDDEESDDENESNYTHLMGEVQVWTLNALRTVYDNYADVVDHDLALQALQRTFECRKALHDTVMNRLSQPNLTDRTGMEAFFAKMSFEDCDKDLRLIHSILGSATSEGDLATLESPVDIETKWKFGERD